MGDVMYMMSDVMMTHGSFAVIDWEDEKCAHLGMVDT